MSADDSMSTVLYTLSLIVLIVVFAFLEQPYGLAAAISLLVTKQLGRINTTLRNKGDKR